MALFAGVTTAQDDAQETIAAFAELAAQILPIEERLSRLLGAAIGSTDSS